MDKTNVETSVKKIIAELATWMMDDRYCPQDSGYNKKTPDIGALYEGTDSFEVRKHLEIARTEFENLDEEIFKLVLKTKERNQEEELEL